jgi:NhaC family Na+:H+ antiporter
MIDLTLLLIALGLAWALWRAQLLFGALSALPVLLIGRALGALAVGASLSELSAFGLVGAGASLSAPQQIASLSVALLALNLTAWGGSWVSRERLTSDEGVGDVRTTTHALSAALLPLSALMSLLCLNVCFYGDETLAGPNQLALLGAAGVAGLIGARQGVSADEVLEGVRRAVSDTLEPLLILLLIGALAGTWMLSGVVPAMIDYGLTLLAPSYFLVATCVLCALVSVASGSSWSTVATIGVALMGVGGALGFSPGLCAGAIISGAYFGDKMSPLSDTTNLAPAMAGGELFAHIRAMLWTTTPAFTLTLLLFTLIGLGAFEGLSGDVDLSQTRAVQEGLRQSVWVHPSLFAVPALVVWLIIKRVPTVPTLAIGALAGGLMAIWAQPALIEHVGGGAGFKGSFMAVMNALSHKVSLPASDPVVAKLLTSKGMEGMLGTVWLILCALTFGGVMERIGALNLISEALLRRAKSDRALVFTTVGSGLFLNTTASDQYLAIIVPGRMYRKAYEERGFEPEALSRTLEDSATVTSVLIPWNTCGAMQASVLGVATFAYAPFAFFNWLSPLMTLLFALMGWRQLKRVPHTTNNTTNR